MKEVKCKYFHNKTEKKSQTNNRTIKGGNHMDSRGIDYTILTIAIIGAVNWGLIGFFNFDLVAFIFGDMTLFSRIIYGLVGISGLYLISLYGRINSMAKA